mgnify:CR=1 FL=1
MVDIIRKVHHIRLIVLFRLHCFGVIQEACNNAVKHAQASYLEVKVSYLEKKIVLVIKDDGKGFDVNAVPDETR